MRNSMPHLRCPSTELQARGAPQEVLVKFRSPTNGGLPQYMRAVGCMTTTHQPTYSGGKRKCHVSVLCHQHPHICKWPSTLSPQLHPLQTCWLDPMPQRLEAGISIPAPTHFVVAPLQGCHGAQLLTRHSDLGVCRDAPPSTRGLHLMSVPEVAVVLELGHWGVTWGDPGGDMWLWGKG